MKTTRIWRVTLEPELDEFTVTGTDAFTVAQQALDKTNVQDAEKITELHVTLVAEAEA